MNRIIVLFKKFQILQRKNMHHISNREEFAMQTDYVLRQGEVNEGMSSWDSWKK